MITLPRKPMPILTIAGLLLPVVGVCAALMLSNTATHSGGWGLGELAIFVFLILGGVVLGAISTLLALVRSERWRRLQAIVLMANVGVAWYLGAALLRRPDVPVPVGEPAFLALAPAQKRLGRS